MASFSRTVTESTATNPASDSVTRQFVGSRTINESHTASDSVSRIYGAIRSIAESTSTNPAVDTVTRVWVGNRTIVETTATNPSVDAVSRFWVGLRSITEATPTHPALDTVTAIWDHFVVPSPAQRKRNGSATPIALTFLTASVTRNRTGKATPGSPIVIGTTVTSGSTMSQINITPVALQVPVPGVAVVTTNGIAYDFIYTGVIAHSPVSALTGVSGLSQTPNTGDALTINTAVPFVRWRFDDPLDGSFYIFEFNPNAGGFPTAKKKMTVLPTTAPDGFPVVMEGNQDVLEVEATGVLRTYTQYNAMVRWAKKQHVVLLTDDIGRRSYILTTEFNPKRGGHAAAPFRMTYTWKYFVWQVVDL
jgi:hypothetical protein